MTNKKKSLIAVLLVVLFVAGFLGYRQYQTYSQKKHEEYIKILDVYNVIEVEGYKNNNPLLQGMTRQEIKKNPPKVEMNGSQGLYISAMAYEYYTGNTLDYLALEKMMNSGEVLEVYDLYKEYIDWLEADQYGGLLKRNMYFSAVANVARDHDTVLMAGDSYLKYESVINQYGDEIKNYLKNK